MPLAVLERELPMLVIKSVSKIYANGVVALADLSLSIQFGEIVAILGASGCGKSTLLRLMCGLDQPTHGKIQLDTLPIMAPHPNIGIVFQEPRLLPWLSVAGNIGFGLRGWPS